MNQPFKILSLSGGGIRGIYQATYLSNIFKNLEKPPHEYFDLICGTSTGAIVALAVALGLDMEKIQNLYKTDGGKIFAKKYPVLSGFFQGSLYNEKTLHKAVNDVFINKKLSDAKTKILITASSIGQSNIETFNNFDGITNQEMSVVDMIMSSTAAPTYFPAHKVNGGERSFIDGGLWANSPSSVGILYAQKYLKAHLADIRLLSIGTTEYRQINTIGDYNKMRLYSIKTMKKVVDLFFCTQESYDDKYARYVLNENNYIKINSPISESIALDKASIAIEKIPQLAEDKARESVEKVRSLFFDKGNTQKFYQNIQRDQLISDELVKTAGLTGFYTERTEYRYRDAATMHEYIQCAEKSLTLVSISLSKTDSFDSISKVIRNKIETQGVKVTISLLNPYKAYLLQSIKSVLGWEEDSLKAEIIKTADSFLTLRKVLAADKKELLNLRFHNSVPFGSAILIDENDPIKGRIHIETKAYKTPSSKSFAFEIMPAKINGFFDSLKEAYNKLINEGEKMQLERKKAFKPIMSKGKKGNRDTEKNTSSNE